MMVLSTTISFATSLLLASATSISTVRSEQEQKLSSASTTPSLRGRGRELELDLQSYPDKTPRIIGGEEAAPGRFPYYALMNGSNLCGAVLISPRFVLTAAHCQDADRDFAIDSISRKVGKEVSIVDRAVHPLYDDFTYSNDIVIFELSEDATNEDGTPASYVRINPEEVDVVGTQMTVIGYGDIDPDEEITQFSWLLNRVDVGYVSNAECNRDHRGEITEEMMCAEGDGRDACYGDSGGPLLLTPNEDHNEDTLVGLVSWGRGCADKQFPGVYTRTSYFYDWIVGTMCVLNAQKVPPYVDCVEILGIDVTDPNYNSDEESPREEREENEVISPEIPVTDPPKSTPVPVSVPAPVSVLAPVDDCDGKGDRGATCDVSTDCCSGRCNILSKICAPPTTGNRDRLSDAMGGAASGAIQRVKNISLRGLD